MVKKKAQDLKKGDKINIGEEILIIGLIELSEIGKQGTKKCRIEATKSDGEKAVLIRPSEYPFNVE